MKCIAILLMAGSGNRFGSHLPKQFHRLGGKPIYEHTLDVFLNSKLFDEILLICPQDKIEQIPARPCVRLIAGGATRQESVYLGLLACPDADIACIHDAVRPFVTPEILQENIAKALEMGAVDTCIPSADTLVHSPHKDRLASIPDRSEYLRGQTPQTFRYPLILKAHQRALEKGIANRSDDCSLILDIGAPVRVVSGSEYNIKITTELDLYLAEQIFRLRCATASHHTSLRGKHFIVTGATGGIGRALCEELKREGAIPIPLARSTQPFAADLTCYTSASQAFDAIHKAFGPVDGLINSIGEFKLAALHTLTSEDIERQLAINLKALIFSCKCAQLKQAGHIVNIASSSYIRGRENYSIYSSAKAAVVNFTQGLAEERPTLYINAIVPQRTLTAMRLENFPDEDPDTLLQPTEVAQGITALLKDTALKGSVIEIRKKFL
jgi:2-C-methyl-D-erythritol 4-phosphate cytidylyltransferase